MTRVTDALAAQGIPLVFENKLNEFIQLLMKWNRSINLSAARSEDEIHDHIVDSLHVMPHLRMGRTGARSSATTRVQILDVGAGGGLPAVVAAICLPDIDVTALEPVHKKHAFLRAVARELAVGNLDPLAERLEAHRRRDYDAAMSRATFDLRDWLLLGAAHVRPGGVVLGFEAVPRSDLPAGTLRHRYDLGGKGRAIVALQTAS